MAFDVSRTGAAWRRLPGLRLIVAHPRISAVAALGLLLAVAFADWGIAEATRERERYDHLIAPLRIEQLNDQFARLKDEIVFFGDSHAAFLAASERLCGHAIIDAAVGGSTVTAYRALLEKFEMPHKPALGVLSIGTNSARRKLLPRSISLFRDEAELIVTSLSSRTRKLVVLAIPPVAALEAATFDLSALEGYSAELRDLCRTPGCTFVDPYGPSRSKDPLIAIEGATEADGVHLANYPVIRSELGASVCP